MARNVWDEPIDKNIPWDGNEDTNNLPVRGSRVEEFLKGSLNSKIGVLFYDTTNNRYLAFADEEERDKYIADPTQTELVLGTFDAPFNYTAEINLASKTYNAVFIGSSGHYIDFTFDVKNKQGASTGESVIVKYTFMRGSNKREVSEIKPFGSAVHFNIDKYLAEGTNTIIVSVTGQNTLAATSVAITYEVVNLQLNDMLDISKVYDLTSGSTQLEIPYSISGYGTKIVEWYIDGEMLDYVRAEDEIVESNTTRTKHITLSNLSQGVHSLQFRAYTTVNGELFYTSTLYRDIIVYTGVKSDMIIAIATSIPSEYGVIGSDGKVALYDMVQYVPYTLRFATYSPANTSNVEVKVKVDNSVKATLNSNNGIENNVVIVPTTSGTKSIEITAGNTKYEIEAEVAPTTMNIQEITNGLVMDFVASEKTNNSSDRDVWEYGDYKGTLSGFAWNNASGWVNNRLEMTSGATLEINYAPLSNTPTSLGKTIEIEWSTKNVKDDNAIICDLRNSNGVGIVIHATKVSMTSADGVTIETEYKSDENVRIAFVINRSTGSTYQRMSFIYANGILSRGDKWALTDSYTSDALLKFQATEGAEVSLKSIRIYDDALSSDNILNNYILYRDTVEEMMEVYDRNDVYEENRDIFSPSKMSSRLPVMIVTGDIPTLENTSDKDTQITVDIEYTNLQDPSRSFKMVGAAMRPQGTSSMGYPKKNFRIYTQKLDTTVVYDATGNVVTDKLYSFKQGAQPVNCWCLKADYAESSGTHNTGIARLWNEALYNAQIDGEYKLRTEAQRIAAASGYEYDVRTTIDGFPILLFYRPSANDDVIFIGKYNFNNDKSTESVFGFKGIPNFDNTHMQCWEVLNNGNPLALFTTTENFDTMWSEAFESRYPDTKTPDITGLKAFAQWMSTVSQANFATEKWAHMDVYKMAAYWVYLMRHAGADQFVKNAMFTSEDGEHFYYILYDNDTINGLINTGHLTIKPTDTRQTVDASGSYVFAGHDSRLWNMLEADEEFINIVAKVDNALYSAGISYDNTIRIFDEEQADKWVEKVYNQDATYKYISPYVDKGIDNLFMLQGKRDLHRRWWLAKRFAIYDAKYVSGQYKSLSVELKCINGTPAGQEFTVTAGYPIDYGYGINNLPRKFGVPLEIGESYTFSTSEVVNLGDPIRIYGAPNIAELDLSKMADRLAVVTISNVYEKALGTRLTKLVVGSPIANNLQVNEISGLRQALMLEYLDVQGMQALTSLDLSAQLYFKTLRAHKSGIASITFAKGAPVERLELPASMRVLSLEQLPYINTDNIILEDVSNIAGMVIRSCPNASNKFTFVYNWYNSKTTEDSRCSLIMDNVNWTGVKGNQLALIANIAIAGGNLSLKGTVKLTQITKAQSQTLIKAFGPNVFDEGSDFYVDAPVTLTLTGPTSILEGENAQYEAEVYPPVEGVVKYSLATGRTGCSINANTGALTTVENGLSTSNIVVRATFTPANGEASLVKDFTTSVVKRTYISNATISGNNNPIVSSEYTWNTSSTDANGEITATWALSGEIVDYVSIASQDTNKCKLTMTYPPLGVISGVLTLTIKKAYNGETIIIATKTLSAELAGVIITGRSNAPIQASLYNAGLVANETHTFESEAKAITAAQLQPGTAATTSIFYAKRDDITHFEEFKYFTGLTTVPNYLFHSCGAITTISIPNTVKSIGDNVFQRCVLLQNIELPTSLTTLGSAVFYGCSGLVELVLPEGVTGCSANCFHDCSSLERLVIPSTFKSVGGNSFGGCGKLSFEVAANNNTYKDIDGVLYNVAGTTLVEYAKDYIQPNYTVVEGTTTLGNYSFCNCYHLTSIVLPSTLKTVGLGSFAGATKLSSITSNAVTAPTANGSDAFGKTTSNYTGRETYSTGNNKLRIPLNASGYDAGQWLDPLQNASKCGFTIHGKLIINSNRSNATFSVSYTTESGSTKSVSVGVGASYISDIKYNTSVTIKPNALSGYTWDSNSVSFTYSATSNSTTLNAHVYPTNATISGETNPVDNPTYTWTTTTANVDGEYTATWALSGDITSYVSIASQSNTSCTLSITEAPTEEITGILTLTIKPKVGNSVTTTKTLKALLPGVVITSKSNAPIQSALYAAGLVANETYSLEQEVKMITSDDLNPNGTQSSSIFYKYRSNITSFEEFKYFTGVDKIKNYTFSNFPKLSTLHIPSAVASIEFLAFYESFNINFTVSQSNTRFSSKNGVIFNKSGNTLEFCCLSPTTFTVPDGVTTLSYTAFRGARVKNIILPETVTTLSYECLAYNPDLISVNIPANITILPESTFAECTALSSITIPANVTEIKSMCFKKCSSLERITMLGSKAPNVSSNPFGSSSTTYTGAKYASAGTNTLNIPINATGYEEGYWLDPLQDASKCNFHIHGKIIITSNKPNATFNIAYISEGDVNKTVTVGVGTFYINDVKYGTSMTVTPNALSGYTWDKSSETITYNGATTVTLNAYIYPSSITISGNSAILGGDSATYTATVAPSNVDIGFTCSWSLSSSANASISSSSSNSCTITTNSVEEEETCILTCVVKSVDNRVTIQKEFVVDIEPYTNFVTAVFDVTNTSRTTKISGLTASNITYMEIDGVPTAVTTAYEFSSKGLHTVKYTLKTLKDAFKQCENLYSVDFSECDGSVYDSFYYTFYQCKKLTNIIYGKCIFPNVITLTYTFYECKKLTAIDLSPFNGAPIGDLLYTFCSCESLVQIDLSPLSHGTIKTLDSTFRSCYSIVEVDLSCLNVEAVNLNYTFYGCSVLERVVLGRFNTITALQRTFQFDQSLKTIICPISAAPDPNVYTFGNTTSGYVGYNTRSTGENKFYVPADATGYDTGYWLDPLQNSEKCGFTIEKTL